MVQVATSPPRPTDLSETVACVLSAETAAWLRDKARREERSVSAQIRRMVETERLREIEAARNGVTA